MGNGVDAIRNNLRLWDYEQEATYSRGTRASVMELAVSKGYEVREEKVDVEYALDADECFCVGTAAVISAIGTIEHGDRVVEYCGGDVGPVAMEMYDALTAIQQRRAPDEFGWTVTVE